MSNRNIRKSILFNTSASTDVQQNGGSVSVAGLRPVFKKNITSIQQVKYRAEVLQVVTGGASSYVPALDTLYAVEVYDPNRRIGGYQEGQKIYSIRTPAAWNAATGATDATRREWIHGELVAKINADGSNKVVAASLGTGTGMTITDDGPYYGVRSQTGPVVLGASLVLAKTNSDGSGFAADEFAVTTAAVTSFGVGATLAEEKPVTDKIFGNLISGVLWAPPLTSAGAAATSGQKYDAFVIKSFQVETMPTIADFHGYVEREDVVYVDNGAGTSTTNLANFNAVERIFHKLIVQQYALDACTTQEWFDQPLIFQGPLGAVPAGTANALQTVSSKYGALNWTCIGTQTIVTPVLNGSGLLLDQDDTATEGAHYSANQQALGDNSFVVGKTSCMVVARVVAGDWTDAQFLVGFRKKAVYAADYNDYTDLAAIGSGAADGDSAYTFGILNNAATVATDTTINYTDATSALVWVKVDKAGAVTCWVNGVKYPVYYTGTTAMVFDDGDEIIPFFQFVNIGSGDPALVISEFFAVSSDEAIA